MVVKTLIDAGSSLGRVSSAPDLSKFVGLQIAPRGSQNGRADTCLCCPIRKVPDGVLAFC